MAYVRITFGIDGGGPPLNHILHLADCQFTMLRINICDYTRALLKIRCDDHTVNWCEIPASVSTPFFGVRITVGNSVMLTLKIGVNFTPYCYVILTSTCMPYIIAMPYIGTLIIHYLYCSMVKQNNFPQRVNHSP